tara:strand:+ start:45 stop:689 length:645 start_codon:yes stop_codon:yes gene_type:complete
MSLASLVDKPLMPNPLAGGGLQITDEQREAFMKARGPEMPQPEVFTNPVTKEILDGFNKSDFAKNVNHMQQDVATININGLPFTSNSSHVGNLTEYIRSIGKEDILSGSILEPGGALSGVPLPVLGLRQDNFIRDEPLPQISDPAELRKAFRALNPNETSARATGGLGDQGLMDRLTSLEQGIGSLQNQIASLFQMGQASDPFGLGGFINQRRF